jgi:ribosomal protein S18 acetylase RimI-like enzyme
MLYRRATAGDVEAIAALHADSWRRHYRGAFADEYLDSDVFTDRVTEWTKRLTSSTEGRTHTVVAENDDGLVGFVHTEFDDDPRWGALLDNLHVRHDLQGGGIGRRLVAESAAAVRAHDPASGLFLWVLEHNTPAQAFYDRLGGQRADTELFEPPGGGSVTAIRYAWPDLSILIP